MPKALIARLAGVGLAVAIIVGAIILVPILREIGHVQGTVVLHAHEEQRVYQMQGFRTYVRTVPYTSTCTRSSFNGKTTTTSTYPCIRYRTETYQQYDHWVEVTPECWRLTIEYEHEPGDLRMTTRCVPRHVWDAKKNGDWYDSKVDR